MPLKLIMKGIYRLLLKGKFSPAPCLFLKGENSDYINQQHLPIIKTLFPQSSLHTVAAVGHWLHAEKPELFNQLVLQFFGENI